MKGLTIDTFLGLMLGLFIIWMWSPGLNSGGIALILIVSVSMVHLLHSITRIVRGRI
jgi:hypothetical protein